MHGGANGFDKQDFFGPVVKSRDGKFSLISCWLIKMVMMGSQVSLKLSYITQLITPQWRLNMNVNYYLVKQQLSI